MTVYILSQVKRRMLEQRHEEESVRMESDILKIKVQLWYR